MCRYKGSYRGKADGQGGHTMQAEGREDSGQ